jgi:hypothetical protein
MTRTREHWWNAEFDLSLCPDWDPGAGLGDSRLVRELSLHWLAAVAPPDSVRVGIVPPEVFLEYLRDAGVEPPDVTLTPAIRRAAEFVPFGWNRRAIELNQSYAEPRDHPPFGVIRQANSKVFSHELEQKLFGRSRQTVVTCFEELDSFLAADPGRHAGWLLKMEHANSGLGNRRVACGALEGDDRRWAEQALKSGPVVLERWLPRVLDLSALFKVDAAGGIRNFALHETVHTASGAVIGAVYDEGSERLLPWQSSMAEAAETVGHALAEIGYWGPVCLDALVWRDGDGALRLRPVVEINARRHATAPWERLSQCWGGVVYGRFLSARKFNLPGTYRELVRALGARAWNAPTRSGILLTSPLWYEEDGRVLKPRKIGLVFRGATRDEVLAMETEFRGRFER